MIGTLIAIIFACIVLGVLFWAARSLLALVPLAEPFATIVNVLLVLLGVLFVIYVLMWILGAVGVHVPFWGRW